MLDWYDFSFPDSTMMWSTWWVEMLDSDLTTSQLHHARRNAWVSQSDESRINRLIVLQRRSQHCRRMYLSGRSLSLQNWHICVRDFMVPETSNCTCAHNWIPYCFPIELTTLALEAVGNQVTSCAINTSAKFGYSPHYFWTLTLNTKNMYGKALAPVSGE